MTANEKAARRLQKRITELQAEVDAMHAGKLKYDWNTETRLIAAREQLAKLGVPTCKR